MTAMCVKLCFSRSSTVRNLKFSTSSFVSNKWRRKQGLEPNPREFSPLTYLPDYSFLDGRPVPLSNRKMIKILHQQRLCEKIVELNHELDVGLEQYYKKQEENKRQREIIKENKLKPKGAALLKTKNSI